MAGVMKPIPIRDPDGTLLGYKCPECDFQIMGSGSGSWHQKIMADISTHIAFTHRDLPPHIEKNKRRR